MDTYKQYNILQHEITQHKNTGRRKVQCMRQPNFFNECFGTLFVVLTLCCSNDLMMPKISNYYLLVIVLRILLRAMSLSQFQFKISMRLQPLYRAMLDPINFKGSRQWQIRQTASANAFLEKVLFEA